VTKNDFINFAQKNSVTSASPDPLCSGGYSLRLQRKRLPEDERKSFDKYIGIKVYENNVLLK